VADSQRRGGGGTSNRGGKPPQSATVPDQTDPEVVLSSAVPPPSPGSSARSPQQPMLAATTQISGSGPVSLEPSAAVLQRNSSVHEDLTSMRSSPVRLSGSMRAQLARETSGPVQLAPDERPKIWVATHKAPPDPDPRLILVREPDSVRAASFRVMRHRIAERGDPRVIAVTSPGPRDGKTTAAANLALALSEFGRSRVLLLEANLRSPQLAVLFGFLPPECFSVQLQRHRERPADPWSIVEAFSPALHVLAVKPGETNRPLLDAPAFAIAIEVLTRVGYDYIVIDTPAVLGSADVNLIEDYVDAVIVTARSGRTMGRSVRAAVEQLSQRKLLGVILLDA
jgi:Mrp family chromosome partitioning ATPase